MQWIISPMQYYLLFGLEFLGFFLPNWVFFPHTIQKDSNSVKLLIIYSHKYYTYIPSSSGNANLYFLASIIQPCITSEMSLP